MYIIQKQLHEHHEISRLFPNVSIADIHYFSVRHQCAYAHTRDTNNNNDIVNDDDDDDKDTRREREGMRCMKILSGKPRILEPTTENSVQEEKKTTFIAL